MDPDGQTQIIHLKNYKPAPFTIKETRLEFFLDPKATKVITELKIEMFERSDLTLDGKDLRLKEISINGEDIAFGDMSIDEESLTIDESVLPHETFILRTEVEINPSSNTSLEGLYISNDMYCTQCEAEGFRKITYYADRPDTLSVFHVKIHSDKPVLLSNGNLISNGQNFAEWHDPWPKPCYLFALVAGELELVQDSFETKSGRNVDLRIYVRKGDEKRCDYAMDALKRSMKWDEKAYGREYDLDLFMIVAVDDFNMGAMENKGLNIFNSKLVLASPQTATDADYAAIESVIAHEYFHNWTGNRITCRDWFQLSLKEGLTVFRDQQFSAHERSPEVQRIEDVQRLRGVQFPEDAGPLAHPVRPESYEEINNFYTATIYEKGAELIRMMQSLVGTQKYREALDLYFERHDGQACTIEDWLKVFEDATGRDFSLFKRWYQQAGTPVLSVRTEQRGNQLHLHILQDIPQVKGLKNHLELLIPLSYAIFNASGKIISEGILESEEREESFTLDAPEGTRISLNRGFSAPIILLQENNNDPAFIARFESDAFNRFEAMQTLMLNALTQNENPKQLLEILGEILDEEGINAAFKSKLLSLPSFSQIVSHIRRQNEFANPNLIEKSLKTLKKKIAKKLENQFLATYQNFVDLGTEDISSKAAGQRELALKALSYLSALDKDCVLAKTHFKKAKLMTDKIGALSILVQNSHADDAIATFYKKYKNERLLIDKWLAIQASYAPRTSALKLVRKLASHECFVDPNPNRWRSLFGAFAMNNPASFHNADGSGYAYYAQRLIEQDAKNPQIAARMSAAFQSFREFGPERESLARAEMEKILNHVNLSKNLGEMIKRLLS